MTIEEIVSTGRLSIGSCGSKIAAPPLINAILHGCTSHRRDPERQGHQLGQVERQHLVIWARVLFKKRLDLTAIHETNGTHSSSRRDLTPDRVTDYES